MAAHSTRGLALVCLLSILAFGEPTPLLGSWQGILGNDPTSIRFLPKRALFAANFNPRLQQVPEFQFEASYTVNTNAKTVTLKIQTLEGVRTLEGKWDVLSAVGAGAQVLKLALGVTTPTTAAAPTTSVGATANPGPEYFVGMRTGPDDDYTALPHAPGGSCKHIAKAGQDLSAIAKLFSLQWQDVFALNGHLAHPEKVQPGEVLSIGRTYRVADGENLWSIATQFGTSWQRLIDHNPRLAVCADQVLSTSPVCRIHAGDQLCVVPQLRNAICNAPNPTRVIRVPSSG